MRWCGLFVVGLLLSAAVPVQADDQAEGLKLVDAAIKAAGGADKLARLDTMSFKAKGSATEGGDKKVEFTAEASVKGNDRFRLQLEMTINGNTETGVVVVNGDKGWFKGKDKEEEAPKETLALIKEEFRALRMAQMLTPLKAKGVKLSALGESKINDRAAMGLKAVQENHPDLDIYFDKETHLPVKCELIVKEKRGDEEREMTTTWFFSDAKAVNGVKHPMKATLHVDDKGKKVAIEMELSEVKAGAKLEDNVFEKP
jgi:outer membrane lipoprotein-sorting protein